MGKFILLKKKKIIDRIQFRIHYFNFGKIPIITILQAGSGASWGGEKTLVDSSYK